MSSSTLDGCTVLVGKPSFALAREIGGTRQGEAGQRRGFLAVSITHDAAVCPWGSSRGMRARELADRFAVMERGAIVMHGDRTALLADDVRHRLAL